MKSLSETCYICGISLKGHGGSVYPTFNEKVGKYVSFCWECSNIIDEALFKQEPFENFAQEDEILYHTIEEMKKTRDTILNHVFAAICAAPEEGNHGQ
jgi:hypothetical protein